MRSVPMDGLHDGNIIMIEELENNITTSIHWQLQFPFYKVTIQRNVCECLCMCVCVCVCVSVCVCVCVCVCVDGQMESNVWCQIAFVKYETLLW